MIARQNIAIIISTATGLSLMLSAHAAEPNDQFIIQQQRQKALEQQLTPPVPDVRLSEPSSSFGRIDFPTETPCFPIQRVELSGQDALPHWLPVQRIADQAQGRCHGGKGINLLMSTMQNRIVDHGWITTRVLAPSQDLKSGTLKLAIVPGYIRHVTLTKESDDYIQLYSAFPAHEGNLLDLRDISIYGAPEIVNAQFIDAMEDEIRRTMTTDYQKAPQIHRCRQGEDLTLRGQATIVIRTLVPTIHERGSLIGDA